MNSPKQIFAVWAPAGAPWSNWAKPVVFAHMLQPIVASSSATSAPINLGDFPADSSDTTAVIDLPGPEGVDAAIALAAKGYRPVPLYNAIPHSGTMTDPISVEVTPVEVVQATAIMAALASATQHLAVILLPNEAPPVFMLDANRRSGVGDPSRVGRFDNRSVSFPTDFPSAVLLRSSGIERIVVIQRTESQPQADLAHTLRRWQEGGLRIEIKALDAPGPPRPCEIPRPSHFRSLWHNWLVRLGLRRNILGGFGGMLSEFSAG